MDQARQTQVLRTLSRLFYQIKDWRIVSIEQSDKKVFAYQDKTGQFPGHLTIIIWSDGRCEAETEGWFQGYKEILKDRINKLNQRESLS